MEKKTRKEKNWLFVILVNVIGFVGCIFGLLFLLNQAHPEKNVFVPLNKITLNQSFGYKWEYSGDSTIGRVYHALNNKATEKVVLSDRGKIEMINKLSKELVGLMFLSRMMAIYPNFVERLNVVIFDSNKKEILFYDKNGALLCVEKIGD